MVAIAAFMVVALAAAACGDDDSTESAGSAAPAEGEAVVGGEATLLQWTESGSLDGAKAIGSSGADGVRMFAVYGALVVFDSENFKIEPVLAETLEANDDSTVWTLKLRPDLVFTDGTALDAAAVKAHWERIQDPKTASPGRAVTDQISSMKVLDSTTLEIALKEPNSMFANSVSRNATNYVVSPTAVSSGQDVGNEPVGAGPFMLENWVRDDRMTLVRNPQWYDNPRPYLDKLTIRVVADTSQRTDTFLTGGGDLFYSTNNQEADRAMAESKGSTFANVRLSSGLGLIFNHEKPPFDDVRVRRAFALAIDREGVTDTAYPGSAPAENFTTEGTPYFTEDAALPELDVEAAQELIDEVVADNGGQPLSFGILGSTGAQNSAARAFVQTALSQLDGVQVENVTLDSPTFLTRVLQTDFEVAVWGFSWRSPEPYIYQNFRSGFSQNVSGYASSETDAAMDEARSTSDPDGQIEAHKQAFVQMSKDMAYLPFVDPDQGYVLAPDMRGGRVWEDGILRVDLIWKVS